MRFVLLLRLSRPSVVAECTWRIPFFYVSWRLLSLPRFQLTEEGKVQLDPTRADDKCRPAPPNVLAQGRGVDSSVERPSGVAGWELSAAAPSVGDHDSACCLHESN